MKLYSSVTLYHYDGASDSYETYDFPKAKVHGTTKVGDLSHGRRSQNQYTVRIFTFDEIKVSCGDQVYSDIFGDTLTVVGFSDNRRGSGRVHHYKLILK